MRANSRMVASSAVKGKWGQSQRSDIPKEKQRRGRRRLTTSGNRVPLDEVVAVLGLTSDDVALHLGDVLRDGNGHGGGSSESEKGERRAHVEGRKK